MSLLMTDNSNPDSAAALKHQLKESLLIAKHIHYSLKISIEKLKQDNNSYNHKTIEIIEEELDALENEIITSNSILTTRDDL